MPRKPSAKSEEKLQCNIHDGVKDWEVVDIHEKVCVKESDFPLTEHTDGKHYCLLHLPTEEKDVGRFEEICHARLQAVEEKIIAFEKLPEGEKAKAKGVVAYDFRCVWFPSLIFLNYKFSARADFSLATFSAGAYFGAAAFSARVDFRSATFSVFAKFLSATFSGFANFSSAIFSAGAEFSLATFSTDAYFGAAIFSAGADFISTTFSGGAYFRSVIFSTVADFGSATFSARAEFSFATFSAVANLSSATFLADADFISTTFSADADFSSAIFSTVADFSSATFSAGSDFFSAKFTETSQIFFKQTNICTTMNLNYAVFAGYVAFEGNRVKKVFPEDDNRKAVLNLQNARLEKPERISFHRVRLRPSWFVNTDSRKMIFTDISWDKLDAERDNSNIFDEIKSLGERGVSEPSRLLEIACRELAINAEENNRYEEASKFRFMAMETKRLEYKWQGRLWTLNWWYKFSSDYGENWKRAFVILLLLLFLAFPIAFSQVHFQVCLNDKPVSESLKEDKEAASPCQTNTEACNCQKRGLRILNGEAFIHSLATATFQNVEYRKPVSFWSEFWVILEKILVPLQAALLALAIRRKFMR